MKRLGKLVLFFFPLIGSAQTCVIVLRLQDGFVVAADSRRTRFLAPTLVQGKWQNVLAFDTVCKVSKSRNIFFSNAGLDIEAAYSEAGVAINESETIYKAAENFASRRHLRLVRYIDSVRSNADLFLQYFQRLKYFSTVFYGIEGGIPKMASVDFNLISGIVDSTRFECKIKTSEYRPGGDGMAFTIGEHDVVDSLLKTSVFQTLGLIEGARFVITEQQKHSPETVSGPFEIFTIRVDGTLVWHSDALGCRFKVFGDGKD